MPALKVKSAQDLERRALERGATVEVEGRPFNVGGQKIERPSRLERQAPAKPAAPEPAKPAQGHDPAALAQVLESSNAKLIAALREALAERAMPDKPVEWRFKVVRGKNNLIEEIIATPVRH